MLRGENSWMAANHHKLGEIELSDSGPSAQPAANFFDHEGATYFEELEEALMQGVVGIRSTDDQDRKSFFTSRPPPTLEIFPSWPMRFQQTNKGCSQSAEESTDSG
ncbi:transcription factor TGAL4-like, partial [Asparagus officinalis]|uniref:transcription factor TGAL4-like n=1 Tax=Asparagus officinalis TaxID=4686 RepID=UPI00098E1393